MVAGAVKARYHSEMKRFRMVREIWAFLRTRKRWWLTPVLLVLLMMGAFIVLAEGSVAMPFIYTLF